MLYFFNRGCNHLLNKFRVSPLVQLLHDRADERHDGASLASAEDLLDDSLLLLKDLVDDFLNCLKTNVLSHEAQFVSYLGRGVRLTVDDKLHDHLAVGYGNLLLVDETQQVSQSNFAE